MKQEDLKWLSDDELLVRLSRVLDDSRRAESVLVAHLAEVDARRLHAREGLPSMYAYCTEVLNLSEAEAYLRISAARASRRCPRLLAMLEDGRLHLSAIGVLAPHLTKANCDELLARATHKSKREVKELVAEIAPKPDVPTQIRKVPERVKNVEQTSEGPEVAGRTSLDIPAPSGQAAASGRSCPEPASLPSVNERDERKPIEPLAPARYKVQFTASAELRDKLERLAALMEEGDLAAVIEAAVTEKLERLEAKRYGTVKRPRKTLAEADTAPGARNIPAPLRRFVWKRDEGQCTFRGRDGRRCPERHRLQFHHDHPFARGGDRSADNIRLLCSEHNLYMAEKDYGKDVMAPYRRPADRVREPSPSLKLRPDAVRLVLRRLAAPAWTFSQDDHCAFPLVPSPSITRAATSRSPG